MKANIIVTQSHAVYHCRKDKAQVTFKVNPNRRDLNASQIAAKIGKSFSINAPFFLRFFYTL
jgi:hypothetical protein